MTDQLTIDFDRPVVRRSDPSTSREAAVISLNRAAVHRELALQALRAAGERGLNDFELANATGVAQTSIGCRRNQLFLAGLVARRMVIADDGLRQDKRTDGVPSGSRSLVWIAAEFERADAMSVGGA